MKIRVPKYFNEFNCIASKCEDTCCAGWGIVIDDNAYDKYMKVDSSFGQRLRSEIVQEGGENIFVLKGNNCPFLNESKLCDIYSELGEEGLCYTCKQYPRYLEEFGNLREVGLSLSCPEAARIILRDSNKVEFQLTESDEKITSYNDINAKLYMELMQCRNIIFNIIQNREISLNKRCSLTLMFICEVQKEIDENNISGIKNVREKYLDSKVIDELLRSLKKYEGKEHEKYNNIFEYFNIFKNLKHITPNDPLGLNTTLRYFWQSPDDEKLYIEKHREFNNHFKDNEYKFENILVYYIFRYFMKSVFDYDASAKIKIAMISFIMIKELIVVRFIENYEITENDLVDISHMYSKDIEHLEENMEALSEIFETNSSFNYENIIITLMN